MAELAPDVSGHAGGARRFLTFRVDRRLYALPTEEISEIVRMPSIARLPQSPKALLGVANLRGSVLPVASLRGLLGREDTKASEGARAIVLDGAAPVILAVDAVEALVWLDVDRVETQQAELVAQPGEVLRGTFQSEQRTDIAKILDIRALLSTAFVPHARARQTRPPGAGAAPQPDMERGTEQVLVTFEVARQEYAMPLDMVQEVVAAPEAITQVPHVEAPVLGMAAYRNGLLPLLSLRGLLGFAPAEAGQAAVREKVIVTRVAGVTVGLVADRMRAIIRADVREIDPVPPVLAARMGGETRIQAIYRGEAGRRLIAILAPDQLFQKEVMQRMRDEGHASHRQDGTEETAGRDNAQFLVFRLGEEEFALPISSIDEVARMPDKLTRIPRTPRFLEGVVNLHGEVLPVIDQRRRFDLPAFDGERQRQRLVVVRSDRHRAGLIVDGVSEVLRISAAAIDLAPDLAGETGRLVHGVIRAGTSGRMVLLLDPTELLSRAERGLLDSFKPTAARTTL